MSNKPQILRLNAAGMPTAWIDPEDAATVIAKGKMIWWLGSLAGTMNGGVSRMTGEFSKIDLPAIIAVEGRIKENKHSIALTNQMLFARDEYMCLYCGEQHPRSKLSRDHVHPVSRDGPNTWTNCVTSCRRCNNRKADRTPEEANMPLLAVPFKPNLYEYFYLENRNVLADQMDYLGAKFDNIPFTSQQ